MQVHEQVTGVIARACPVCGPTDFRVEDRWLTRGPFGALPVSTGRLRRLVCTGCAHRVFVPPAPRRSMDGLAAYGRQPDAQ